MKQKTWQVILYASLLSVVLFGVVMFGLRDTSPAVAKDVSYKLAEKAGGDCYDCHAKKTPGVTEDYAHSKHATRGVSCLDCHKPGSDKAETIEHHGTKIVVKPTPLNCAGCHKTEVSQFEASNHAARSWYSIFGAKAFTPDQLKKYHLLDSNGKPKNDGKPNATATLMGNEAMKLGCTKCHEIGKVQKDSSIGDCSSCHVGHSFSLEQVRKPETCAQCHLGPDHPQKEIYDESPHGTLYNTKGSTWNWNAPAGTLTAKDTPAPTCATCHMSGFGGVPGTHNVGERLSWNLTPDIATKRENWQTNRTKMTSVCLNCHSKSTVEQRFNDSENVYAMVNKNVATGKSIVKELQDNGLESKKPFDSSVDFKMFELWHHEGRRARFGAIMGGPDYVQWHGIFEQKKDLVELREMAEQAKINSAQQKTR